MNSFEDRNIQKLETNENKKQHEIYQQEMKLGDSQSKEYHYQRDGSDKFKEVDSGRNPTSNSNRLKIEDRELQNLENRNDINLQKSMLKASYRSSTPYKIRKNNQDVRTTQQKNEVKQHSNYERKRDSKYNPETQSPSFKQFNHENMSPRFNLRQIPLHKFENRSITPPPKKGARIIRKATPIKDRLQNKSQVSIQPIPRQNKRLEISQEYRQSRLVTRNPTALVNNQTNQKFKFEQSSVYSSPSRIVINGVYQASQFSTTSPIVSNFDNQQKSPSQVKKKKIVVSSNGVSGIQNLKYQSYRDNQA